MFGKEFRLPHIVVDSLDQNILEGNHLLPFLDEFLTRLKKFLDGVTIIDRHDFSAGLVVSSVQGDSQTDLGGVFCKFQYLGNQATRRKCEMPCSDSQAFG